MSTDVSCAAATQEIFMLVTREQGECQGVLGRPGGISCWGEKDVRNWLSFPVTEPGMEREETGGLLLSHI